MTSFIVRPVSQQIAAQVRATRRSPQYGHPVHQELAGGTGPCRECLQAFDVGQEDRLLFTYSPFPADAPLPQPGPVFIHANECRRHEGPGFPPGLLDIPLAVQAYHEDGSIAEPRRLAPGEQSAVLATLLEEPRVAFVHLRHAEAGCFIARAERLDA